MTAASWVFRKHWHPRARWRARVRALWLIVVSRHEAEICCLCGGRVGVVWWVDHDLYGDVTGYRKDPNSTESAGGVFCIQCFDDLAGMPFLRWTAVRDTTP